MQPIQLKKNVDAFNGKEISFRVLAIGGNPKQEIIAEGDGILNFESTNEDGMYIAFISVAEFPNNSAKFGTWSTYQIPLYQEAVDCLEILADGRISCLDSSLPS